jgi:uncharacterized protein YndB with AHSA1/START domain
VSSARLQAFIQAPVPVVWDLVADVDRHPEWWPRVIAVHCEGLEEGCTYREVVKSPFGSQEDMEMMIDRRAENEELRIRCINTGTYFKLALTEARSGTFVDGEAGMEPATLQTRVFDALAGKRYFSTWMRQTLDALDRVARTRAGHENAA